MKTIKEVADFIKDSVENLMYFDDARTYRMILDADFAIYVGWGGGFDKDDDTLLHSNHSPEYCVCVKVAENIPNFSWEDAYMPWDVVSGEVYDTDCSVSLHPDYKSIAKWLLDDYKDMRKQLDNGEITFGN